MQGEEGEEAKEEEEEDTPKRIESRPNTTLKQISKSILPDVCFRFLYSRDNDFKVSRFFLGATLGFIFGLGIYFLFVHPMALPEEQKIKIMYGISGSSAFGWATSSYFRCSTLVLIPNLLGKEGRTYITLAVIATLYAGPVVNLQKNIEEIARSVSCTIDLQINHTKLVWREMMVPVKNIVQNLANTAKEIKNGSDKIMSIFKEMEDEMDSTEGYSKPKEKEVQNQKKIESTQKKIELKTMLRCEYVIELGISKCQDWFAQKHEECMRAIWLPVLNSLLCLPMKASFLCNVMYLVNMWCKNRLPLEGNFGQAFDLVNETVRNLDRGFSSTVVVTKDQNMSYGVNLTQLSFTEEVMETLMKNEAWVLRKMSYINTFMICLSILLFVSAFNYTIKYNTCVIYDNCYVTTYFRQIDARRRKLSKKHLLPLRRLEKIEFVFPFSLRVQGPETETLMMEMFQCSPTLFIFIAIIGIDRLIILIFKIIHKHFEVSYVFSIDNKLEVLVGGDSIVARLLKLTVNAFNSTSKIVEIGNNTICLPNPSIMSFLGYLNICWPIILLLLSCFLQVYGYRLRRVIASFYFPKREKTRVLFLYNEHLRKRKVYIQQVRTKLMKKSKHRQIWEKTFWGRLYSHCLWTRYIFPGRCIICSARKDRDSHECTTPGCYTVYCAQCWWDMDEFCLACVPYEKYDADTGFEYVSD